MKSAVVSHSALLVAAMIGLLPVMAFASPAANQATSPEPPVTTMPSAAPRPQERRPPMDAHAQEADLGLTGPANPSLPSLILVGDSTVRNGHGKGSDGLWGWGAPIADLFDPAKINVVNRAIGGLSSHTYISQGHWANTLELIKPGDFVLIQFGHNDGGLNLPGAEPVPDQGLPPGAGSPARSAGMGDGATPPAADSRTRGPNIRGSLPGTGDQTLQVENPYTHQTELVHAFGWYLRKYIEDVRAKGATPILCSLVPRKIWVDGHIRRNTETYRGWAQAVAADERVPFIDLNEIIARRYDAMGEAAVDPLFGDPHTHTTWAGAVLNAEAVVSGLRALPGHPLDRYLSPKGKEIKPFKP